MNTLRVRDTELLNFKSAQSLLSTFFVCAARALLCEWRLELGGVGIYGSKDRRIFPILDKFDYIRARILRQGKLSEYIIIDNKVGDDHRS
jgi:hypothetical protein